ncbi:MAG: tocopherol cyclase family protein [Bacteroidota bacterium]
MFKDAAKRWRATWNPDMYHGWGRQQNYFEGWYFKIVDPKEQYVFAIIPGIAMEPDGKKQAFIQVLDGKACKAAYHKFAAEDFQANDQVFGLQLEKQFFSDHTLRLNLPELKGELKLNQLYRWPKMLGAPGIMGWYSFVPFMQCYHGVVSMNHTLTGQLDIGGQTVHFDGGKGYLEKDWGRSFPSSWIWTQSNHFDAEDPVSIMASIARIPWLGSHFIGYIVGFLFQGQLYRFATYTGAMMKAQLGEEQIDLAFKDRRYRLVIKAQKGPGGELVSPLSGAMTGKVNESMQARLHVQFYDQEKLRFEGEGRNAGLEAAGPVEELLTDKWRR